MSCHGCDELAEAFARATAGCGRCAHAPADHFGPFECGAYRDGKSITYQELCGECIHDLKISDRYTRTCVVRGVASWMQWSPKRARRYCWRVGAALPLEPGEACPECGSSSHRALDDEGACGSFARCGDHGHPCMRPIGHEGQHETERCSP